MMKLADETVVEDLSAVEGANLYTHTHGRVGASHFEEPQNEGCQEWGATEGDVHTRRHRRDRGHRVRPRPGVPRYGLRVTATSLEGEPSPCAFWEVREAGNEPDIVRL